MTDISETLAPKSDQLDNIDLLDGPRTFTVAAVDVNPRAEQPVSIHLAEFPRPWRPGKNMRRVLAHYWTSDSSTWIGRSVTLFRDADVTFGKDKPGGTRISHMSDLQKSTPAPVMLSQGRMGTYAVQPLAVAPKPDPAQQAVDWFASKGIDQAALEAHVGATRDQWTRDHLATLKADAEQIIAGGAA